MSGYADEDEAKRVLGIDTMTAPHQQAWTVLAQMNTDLAAEIDGLTGRTFTASGTTGDPVVWTRDVPFGSLLPLPDFTELVSATRAGTDVTADVIPRTLTGADGPPWQALLYAPAGVVTSWADGLTAIECLSGITVAVVAGWGAALPRPLVALATKILVREWRARIAMYTGGAGDGGVTIAAPTALLSDDDKGRLALMGYVRPVAAVIRAGA